jgi:hypothetical protein
MVMEAVPVQAASFECGGGVPVELNGWRCDAPPLRRI